jgi:L-ascorbate metabolism protein UlaG (beta-lactamase superfamily)
MIEFMIVNYFGQGCFKLQSGEKSILIDPINNRLKADIILRTISPVNLAMPLSQNEFAFAGEYDISGIEIYGFQVEKESTDKFIKTIFLVNWEGIRFVFLGPISTQPEGEFLDDISEPDVLFIPASGKPFLKPEDAQKLIKNLEPKIIIPSFISEEPKEFLKLIGQKPQKQEKFVFKKKDVENKSKEVIILEAKL